MSALEEPKDPKAFNTPDRLKLDETDVQGLGQAIMALTKEIWVMRDRMYVMEKVLERNGISITDEIDTFQPDEDMRSKLNDEGRELVGRVLNALTAE